jgi:cytidylate kinase
MPGAVLDGRDIGTVVCPNADLKLFVSASPEVRAMRRHEEQLSKGKPSSYPEILSDLKIRDERDASRADSPMKKACDALLLDTSKMDIETAFLTAKKWADEALVARNRD